MSRSDHATPYSDPSNTCPPWSASGWHAAFLKPALPSLTWPSAPAALNHWLFREHTGFSLTSSLCHCGWPSRLQWLLPFCSRTLLDNSRSNPITIFPKRPLLTLSSPLLAPLPAAAAHPHRATFFLCSHPLCTVSCSWSGCPHKHLQARDGTFLWSLDAPYPAHGEGL